MYCPSISLLWNTAINGLENFKQKKSENTPDYQKYDIIDVFSEISKNLFRLRLFLNQFLRKSFFRLDKVNTGN